LNIPKAIYPHPEVCSRELRVFSNLYAGIATMETSLNILIAARAEIISSFPSTRHGSKPSFTIESTEAS